MDQDVTEGGGAKMFVERSVSGRPLSSENLRCEVVTGCCETLQHRHGYHGSSHHNTFRLRLTSLTQLDAPPLISGNLESLLSKWSPKWGRAGGIAEVPLIPDVLRGAAVTKGRYKS